MSVRAILHRPIFFESLVLCLMCLVDAWLTLMLFLHGWASEGNPLMSFFLERGVWVFLIAKLAYLLPGVVACEVLKWRRPTFARMAIRVGLFGYLGVYVLGDLRVNGWF
ncbi:MAG: hypothetical protein HY248_05565 [Fimbriimonas ginsengisoli]|nr:hypothetical protein [Fimbriimonas ginsengisoli]